MNSLDYAKACCDTVVQMFPQGELPPDGHFHYHAGVFLHGMEEVYLLTGEQKYDDYIINWLRRYIDERGAISGRAGGSLDDIQACNLLVRYCREGRNVPGFCEALNFAGKVLKNWNTNQFGGFWHHYSRPNQMWLDSVYMGQLLGVRYGLWGGDNWYIENAELQMRLLWEHAKDEKTGLLYHAWDAVGEADWHPDTVTGCSSEIWCRALGWYIATAALLGEDLVEKHPVGQRMLQYGAELGKALLRYQDKKKHMWYQVVDKGDREDNWLESSGSCLFTFALAKLIRLGALEGEKYVEAVREAYHSIIENFTEFRGGDFILKGVCIGTPVCDYKGYIERPTKENDLHGMGAFGLMCTEYYKTFHE